MNDKGTSADFCKEIEEIKRELEQGDFVKKYKDLVDTINCLYEFIKEEERLNDSGVEALENFISGELNILETLKRRM